MAPKRGSETPLPASLVLRVAEAADGFRDGRPHWFLVTLKAPHKVTPFDSASAAQAALKKAGARKHTVQGPFLTRPEPRPKGARARKARRVERIEVYFEGKKKPVVVKPGKVDAIFLSASALDKFAYPYYSRVHGVARTAEMRAEHLSLSEDPVIFHEPWTEGDPPPPPNGD